jgi:DNA-binding transcriptional regulator YiaG
MEIPKATAHPVPTSRQVKAIRAWLGLSQGAFAKEAGLALSTIVEYEQGKRRTSPESLAAIALYVSSLSIKWDGDALVLPA